MSKRRPDPASAASASAPGHRQSGPSADSSSATDRPDPASAASASAPGRCQSGPSADPTSATDRPDPAALQHLKVALVCDWLTDVGGSEKVLLAIHQLFPNAPIYTSQYRPKRIDWFKDADVRTGWLQRFPAKLRRFLGPLRQLYFSHLDLSDYDLVISVTGAEAKAVKAPNGVHVSYCHVPTQYYWQLYDEYLKNPGFGILNPIVRFFFRLFVAPLRRADFKAAQSPNYFVTISNYAKDQIQKYYGRDATVIHPPVDLDAFRTKDKQPPIRLQDGCDLSAAYVVSSRQVNWKRIDLVIRAAFLSQRHVVIIGKGPEHRRLVKLAKGSDLIQFLPLMQEADLAKYLRQARGFLFPSREPFGIAPVEAMAAGCPVVAFAEGGAKDYVQPGVNGVLFAEQTPISLAEGIIELEKLHLKRQQVSHSVDHFSRDRFDRELLAFIDGCEKGEESPALTTASATSPDATSPDPAASAASSSSPASASTSSASSSTPAVSATPEHASDHKADASVTSSPDAPEPTHSARPSSAPHQKSTKAAQNRSKRSRTAQKILQKATQKTPPSAASNPTTSARPTTSSKSLTSAKPTAAPQPSTSAKPAQPSPPTDPKPAKPAKFPIIREDFARTRELVKKAEEAKEANKPAFPKIGG